MFEYKSSLIGRVYVGGGSMREGCGVPTGGLKKFTWERGVGTERLHRDRTYSHIYHRSGQIRTNPYELARIVVKGVKSA